IWGILISLVMLFLTLGYRLGGRLADRNPQPRVLYALIGAAGAAILAVPLLAGPVLTWATRFPTPAIGADWGVAPAVILLFGVPITLLGCVSPFAIRLRLPAVARAGHTAGALYALATAGSIAGTFIPV